jgi:hypothetical protein
MTMQPYDGDPADGSALSGEAELSRRTLGSEQVILDAPMSFTGCTKRTLRFARDQQCQRWWSKTLAVSGLVLADPGIRGDPVLVRRVRYLAGALPPRQAQSA